MGTGEKGISTRRTPVPPPLTLVVVSSSLRLHGGEEAPEPTFQLAIAQMKVPREQSCPRLLPLLLTPLALSSPMFAQERTPPRGVCRRVPHRTRESHTQSKLRRVVPWRGHFGLLQRAHVRIHGHGRAAGASAANAPGQLHRLLPGAMRGDGASELKKRIPSSKWR